jgi:hypothetical protein
MMELDETTAKFYQIFHPGYIDSVSRVHKRKQRFAYYTNAETAIKILTNSELWFRNAVVMNDFSEIAYGLDMIQAVFSGDEGRRFRESVEDIFPGVIEEANKLLTGWERDWRLETYLACISVHDRKEDERGRLSMWRAYGNTALIINNTPLTAVTDLLSVYSTPVQYLTQQQMAKQISKISDSILVNRKYLLSLGKETLVAYIHNMLFRIAIATKHPGFEEEKEWRLYYRPKEHVSPAMTEEIVTLNGIPQKVYKLRLADEPHNGLHGADVPSLLDRVIIGPTAFPYVSFTAFEEVLKRAKVSNPRKKVVVSDIPLRVG